jgi:ribose-phosphate pyrophosphokinase
VAEWIGTHVQKPAIVGPDAESAQWVKEVAGLLDCPMVVLEKDRRGDRDVSIRFTEASDAERLRGRSVVLLDDIISTGRTMLEALTALGELGKGAVCMATHAVFADPTDGLVDALQKVGARAVVTSNTIAHPSNAVDVGGLLVDALAGAEFAQRRALGA